MSIATRVLLVDYSIIFREILQKRFHDCSQINMLPAASEPYDAIHKVNKYQPDIVICSNELPYMTGIELIRKYLSKLNIPIIAMSVNKELQQEALQAGAKHFVVKPSTTTTDEGLSFTSMLQKMTMQLGQQAFQAQPWTIGSNSIIHSSPRKKLIAIGATSESIEAAISFLSELPSNSPPVLLMHQASIEQTYLLSERLKAVCSMRVTQANEGDYLQLGSIMVASTASPLRLQSDNRSYYVTRVQQLGASPMDSFFQSVALTLGSSAVGMLFAGVQNDGLQGFELLRQTGAQVFVY